MGIMGTEIDNDFDEYTYLAGITARGEFDDPKGKLLNWMLGLIGEVGETSELIMADILREPHRLEDHNQHMVLMVLRLAVLLSHISEPIKKNLYHGKGKPDPYHQRHTLERMIVVANCMVGNILSDQHKPVPLAYRSALSEGNSKKLEPEALASELGDILWYTSQMADANGLQLFEIARANIKKLSARWPEGFTPDGRSYPDQQ